ncbi:tetratricopeptide repeat protein [Undibacterium sp. Di26W]|uniref:tetratricopeptide repeat protein n=1 Tax=Undibacterium sp. Di26W TaxID=3413035 RepID=UPI003BF3EDC0
MNEIALELLDEIFSRAEDESKICGHEIHVVELLQSYLISRPEHARAWALYGEALRELGRNKDSLIALSRAYELASDTYKGHIAMQIAVLARDFQSPAEAKKWFEIGIKHLGNEFGWPWIICGSNLVALGEFAAAIICFETTINNNHEEKDEAYFNLGLVYRALERYEQAITCFENAIQITPNYDEAKSALDGMRNISKTLNLTLKLRKTLGQIH